jgi:TPR repeat protein
MSITALHSKEALFAAGLAGLKRSCTSQEAITAVFYFAQAASQGFPPAQYYLATCYSTGWGVPRNEALAARLFKALYAGGYFPPLPPVAPSLD